MTEIKNSKQKFDLEERTFNFAQKVREFVRKIPKTTCNFEDAPQLVRASGSVAANYIEANDALSKKDFYMRIKICRKEAKESRLWLKLIDLQNNHELEKEKDSLIKETTELMNIFGAIIRRNS